MSLRLRAAFRSPFRFLGAGCVVAAGLLALFGAGCSQSPGSGGSSGSNLAATPHSEDAFGVVSDFSFTERSGRTVTLEDLLGRVWVCDFFFTTCNGPCPTMSANMRELQDRLEGTEVQLVSFSVDPTYDTVDVLREYADLQGADPERWWFLTGEESAVEQLCFDSFSLALSRIPKTPDNIGRHVAHSTKFIVVDETGAIRGYYEGEDEEGAGLSLTVARARALERARLGEARPETPLPAINASLNGLAAVLLGLGFVAIKRGRRERHAFWMRAATVVSAAFLACYLYYHFVVTAEVGPTRFTGTGWTRPAYLALLLSHTVLAAVNLPMVLRTLWLAHKERWDAHRRLAKVTFPIWMYVSVTGVLVYLALYQWNPS